MESQEKEKDERSSQRFVQKDARCQLTSNYLFNETDLRPLITDPLLSSASSHGI